jgi:hypothetical protein
MKASLQSNHGCYGFCPPTSVEVYATALSPTFTITDAPNPTPIHASCTFGSWTIPDGTSVTAYLNGVDSPCQSQERLCTNGTLSGSYQNAYCGEIYYNPSSSDSGSAADRSANLANSLTALQAALGKLQQLIGR